MRMKPDSTAKPKKYKTNLAIGLISIPDLLANIRAMTHSITDGKVITFHPMATNNMDTESWKLSLCAFECHASETGSWLMYRKVISHIKRKKQPIKPRKPGMI